MLPKIEHPTFPLKLPLSGKTVNIRPMTIKDEKIMLMAGDNVKDRLNHLKQIITNCVVEDIDVDQLSFVDFQFLFLQIRATSVDNLVQMNVTENGKSYSVEYDLTKPKFKNLEQFKNKSTVMFGEKDGIKFKSPTFADVYSIPEEDAFDPTTMIVKSVEMIFFGDDVFDLSVGEKYIADFIDELPAKTLKAINDAFIALPSIYFEGTAKDSEGNITIIEVTDFTDFF